MKKLILILFCASPAFCFGQSFSYEPRKVEPNGVPSWSSDSMEITYPYIVTVGIVGEPYGFVPASASKSMYTFTLSTKEARSPEVLQKYAWSKAYEWVQQNYPDIK